MKTSTTVIAILLFALPSFASAAVLNLSAMPTRIGVGDTLELSVDVDSSNLVNAFSASITYSPEDFELTSVRDGNSIVSVWIQHPTEIATGTVEFAGVTPGGYAGSNGRLFSLLFRAKREGLARFSAQHAQILRADGEGTPEHVEAQSLTLSIGGQAQGGFVEKADREAPESFEVVFGRDTSTYEGKPYVAFSAVDKNSGVNRYEVAETRLPQWLIAARFERTSSPYIIRDPYLTSAVIVRAIDNAGNVREVVFHRTSLVRPYEWILCGILIVLAWLIRRKSVS